MDFQEDAKMDLKELIRENEGLRLFPYKDSIGKLTIGYGRNLTDRGINEYEAERMLEIDIAMAKQDLYSIFGDQVSSFSENRFNALVDMLFNLGKPKFSEFVKMIRAIKNRDWEEASDQLLDSNYAQQVENRAKRNALFLRKG
jgi:lysozyme